MEITNYCNYCASYTLTSLPLSVLQTVKRLLLTEQSARKFLPQQALPALCVRPESRAPVEMHVLAQCVLWLSSGPPPASCLTATAATLN